MREPSYPISLVERLDTWVNELATPLMPPVVIREGAGYRLEFRDRTPNAVLIGKLVRAVSGLRAALLLAGNGYLTECGSLLRIVSDFCTEVTAIAGALIRSGELPKAVKDFIEQYFTPRARTPDEYAERRRMQYVRRSDLLKAAARLSEGTSVDAEQLRKSHQFLNMTYDAYVHGAYETAMELLNPATGEFAMRGHPDPGKRQAFTDAVFLKLHEVVTAIELTAAVTGCAAVFNEAREGRRSLDRWTTADRG